MVQSTIKTQAQEIARNRWQRLVANYPNQSEIRGLGQGEIQRKLERFYGSENFFYWTDVPTIENWLNKQKRNFILVMAGSVLCLLVWAGFMLNTIIGVLGSGSGLSVGTIAPIIAFVVAVGGVIWYITNRIKAMRGGHWNIKMGKGR